jgi:hypothetical protein
MKSLRSRLLVLAGGAGLAFAFLVPLAPAADAALQYMCDEGGGYNAPSNDCWVNNGLNTAVSTDDAGSGWRAVDADTTWDGHEMYYLETGSDTCAFDGGTGTYLDTESCDQGVKATELFWLSGGVSGPGAIVSDFATGDAGHLQCLWADVSNDYIGNATCPSGETATNETWYFATQPGGGGPT